MNFAWRWTPANNPNDAPNNKYDGFGSATYSRTGGCQNGVAHGGNFKLTASRTTDWVDPAYREKLKLVAQGTGNGKCDAQVKGTYDIRQNGPNGRKMILNFPEVSHFLPGERSSAASVVCLYCWWWIWPSLIRLMIDMTSLVMFGHLSRSSWWCLDNM